MLLMKSLAGKKTALLSSVALAIAVLPPLPAAAKVGVAAAVNTDAKSKAPGAGVRVISIGESVVYNEQITTDSNGLVQILLLDGTTFTVGPDSQLTIDEFVYDPNRGEAKVVASLTKGAFRFIGGQASKSAGGATVRTPVGTIGIRGAMVEGNIKSGGSATFSMIFGKEVTFLGRGGARSNVFKPGYTLEVKATGGGTSTDVRPRTAQDAAAFQTALAGNRPAGSTGGGASQAPTDRIVQQSPVTRVVSNLPSNVNIPPNRPSPVQASKIDTVEDNVAQINVVTQQQVVDDLIEQGATTPPGTDDGRDNSPTTGSGEVPPTGTGSTYKRGRVLTAGTTYMEEGYDYVFLSPGSRGLVGGPGNDAVYPFLQSNGRLISSHGYNLPDITGTLGDNGLMRVDVQNGLGPNGPLSGPAYAGAGDFAAYLLSENGDPTKPVYTIVGTPTPAAAYEAIQQGDSIRTYTLTPDPIRPSALPFFATDVYGTPSNSSSSDFVVLEPGSSDNDAVKPFLAYLDISGSGLNQKSAGLVLADIVSDNASGLPGLDAGRRGSFRPGANAAAYNMRGSIATLSGPDGADIFGPNAENFVLGASLNPTATMYDVSYDSAFSGNAQDGYAGDGEFSTIHVADLKSETPQTAVARNPRDVRGFMTGIGESSSNPNGYRLGSPGVANFFMNLNDFNTVGANGVLDDKNDEDAVVDALQLGFGTYDGNGGATFVDDNRYGANQSNDRSLTRLYTDGDQDLQESDSESAGSYLMSGRAVPLTGYEHCEPVACDFIDWGWWGTRVVTNGNTNAETPSRRAEYVHLGTWVAGDITSTASLPTTIVATYSGTALGTVARTTASGVARYIARGTFGMTFDFNARQGDMSIDNFDGMSLAGTVDFENLNGEAYLTSDLTGGSGLTGQFSGTFVNNRNYSTGVVDHAAGVIGEFQVDGPAVKAIGTVAAARTGTAPVTGPTVRVLTAPDVYILDPDDPDLQFPAAGSRGLVGSTPETDRNILLSARNGRLVSGIYGVDLPDYSANGENGLESLSATYGRGNGQYVAGPAYAGRGDFTAYLLGLNNDPTQPFYVITGTATPAAQYDTVFTGADLREYTLTQDPIRPSVLPFFAQDIYGAPSNYNVSNLYLAESNTRSLHTAGESNYDTRLFESWIDISGTGANQKSAIFAMAPGLDSQGTADNGLAGIDATRRGSFRATSTSGPAQMRGAIGTIASAQGAHFFGDDLNNFVLGASPSPPNSFFDNGPSAGFTGNENDGYVGGGDFSTHHVADQVGTSPLTGLTRTQRSVTGFMAGIGESNREGINAPYALTAQGGAPNFEMFADPEYNSVRGSATVYDVGNQNPVVSNYLLNFGYIPNNNGGSDEGGDNAFIDDNRYASLNVSGRAYTRLRTDGGQDLRHSDQSRAGSYFVSGRATPVAGYQHCTSCDFIDWGWWGTRVQIDPSGNEIPNRRTDYVHMGTWVAGDITNPADLPTNLTASYAGTALGNVARTVNGQSQKYIAAGTMAMQYDFSTRTGALAISNFDNINATGLIAEQNTATQALFGGNLTDSANGIQGTIDGAFVNNGAVKAAGVIGQFNLSGTGVQAVGTIAGSR